MRLADCVRALAAIAMMIGATAQADEPKYGKVETFQPGKKYTCVPTADHKGWDCNEITAGSAPADKQGGNVPTAETTPLPGASAERTPEPIPAAPASTPAAPPAPVTPPAQPKSSGLPAYLRAGGSSAPAQTAAVAESPTPAARPAPAPAAPPEAKPAAGSAAPARVVESRAPPAANATPAPAVTDAAPAATAMPSADAPRAPAPPTQAVAPPMPAARAPQAPVAESTAIANSAPAASAEPAAAATQEPAAQARASATQESAASPQPVPATPTSTPRPVHEPVSAPRPREAEQPAPAAEPSAPAKTAPPAPAKSAAGSARGNREFLALPASDYVIELAHSANAADFAALRASLQPTRGQLYELHLRRDNGDWWLLVWGSFDSVDAARGARAELPADAAINAGWPRRIGALQSEARRVSPNQD
ncbi:MAG TPA: SPOR domain-containing protein [Rhodanobacteraceae bacterium]|nr:SPOR domain-containing protein [Rhodanobacteraceae bacterium]